MEPPCRQTLIIAVAAMGLGITNADALDPRIDRDHSNAFEAWMRMGSPRRPTPEQRSGLERSSELALLGSPEWVPLDGGKLTIRFPLPRQAVSLLIFERGRRPESHPASGPLSCDGERAASASATASP